MSRRVPEYPVDVLPEALRNLINRTSLDPALLAGAGLGAMAVAAAPAELLVDNDPDPIRPILWIPLLGKPSSGKSPAMKIAFRPLRDLERKAHDEYKDAVQAWMDAGGHKSGEEQPANLTRIMQDVTIEMLARALGDYPYRAQVLDELSRGIRSLGQYKAGGGADRDKWLELWTGETWRYSRVGSSKNPVDEYIDAPVVSVVGGIQNTPDRLALLGDVTDGFRPRWLPHLATQAPGTKGDDRPSKLYKDAIEMAYQDGPRTWTLSGAALRQWRQQASKWKSDDLPFSSDQALAAVGKADMQCLRIALVLSEFSEPGDYEITTETIRSAIAIMNYVLRVWEHVDTGEFLTVSHGEKVMNGAAQKWYARVDAAGGELLLSKLIRGKVGGVRNTEQVYDVLDEYAQNWVVEERDSFTRAGKKNGTATWLTTRAVRVRVDATS